MATGAQIKTSIDTNITNKTQPQSINNTLVGADIKSVVDYVDQEVLLKENLTNKSINITIDATSDIKYPSVKAFKDYVDQTKEDLLNKSTDIEADSNSDIKYPSVKATKYYIDNNTVSLTQNIITAQNNYDNILTGYFNAVVSVSSTDRVVLPEGLLNGSTLLIRPVGLNASFKISGTITNPQQIHALNQTSWFTEYQVEGKNQVYRLTKFDDNQWFIEIIKDNSLVINGITPVSEGTLRLCDVDFSATPLTSTQLQSIFGDNLLYPIGYKYYQPNATGGPIVFTKLAPDYWTKQTCTIAT